MQVANAGIAVQTDDENVAEVAGVFESGDVAGMQQIEAPVGENDAAAIAFIAAELQNRLVKTENTRMQRNPTKARRRSALVLSEKTFYHARKLERLRERRWR